MPTEFALAQLQTLHGVGPWTAAHMLLRGATARDALPLSEPRVLRAFTHVSGRPEREFIQRAEAWKPFRMWVSMLLVRELAKAGKWAAVPQDFARRGRFAGPGAEAAGR